MSTFTPFKRFLAFMFPIVIIIAGLSAVMLAGYCVGVLIGHVLFK